LTEYCSFFKGLLQVTCAEGAISGTGKTDFSGYGRGLAIAGAGMRLRYLQKNEGIGRTSEPDVDVV
jgi:hypothetical protein